MIRTRILLCFICFFGFVGIATANWGGANLENPYSDEFVLNTPPQDTIPLEERYDDFINGGSENPFDLEDPSIVEQSVEYDAATNQYIITEKIGDDYYRMPTYMTFSEYTEWQAKEQEKEYFRRLAGVSGASSSVGGKLDPMENIDVQKLLVDRLFGGTKVDIQPQGNIDLDFGVRHQNNKTSTIPLNTRRRTTMFDFDMGIQMSVDGQIGEKLKLSTSYNTQATFDFDNIMKLEFDSDAFSEDDIIKKIEAGNVSMPLRGNLIQGSQTLFGVKTQLQFGRLYLTAVAAQQKSEKGEVEIKGGAQEQEFEVYADEYDENRHFFLSHYNRDIFEKAMKCLPNLESQFKIVNLEVWVTNDRNVTENNMNVVALTDLGEYEKLSNPGIDALESPDMDFINNKALPYDNEKYGSLYGIARDERRLDRVVSYLTSRGLVPSRDFEKINARKLNPNEYDFHPELGFVSVNINLQPDQVLGVAYQYAFNGGEIKNVGELFNEAPNGGESSEVPDSGEPGEACGGRDQQVLFLKMLKATTPRVDLPIWDLMMKNVYPIGAYQVNPDEFRMDVYYDDPGKGLKRFLPETSLAGQPLIEVFNLDRLNSQRDPQSDGYFDFVPGETILPASGKVIFPVLEPFGSTIAEKIGPDPAFQQKYVYQELYDSTLFRATEYQEKNRYVLKGRFKSSVSNEIYLGTFNLPEGSVRVSGGGMQMVEGVDYVVDYSVGKVKILNDAVLASGAPVNVSYENSTSFGFNTKTMLGLRADYEVSKNLNIGGTFMNLFERPFTQKVNMGDDPINNKVYGLDINYSKEAPWITRMVDKLPLLETKAESRVSFTAEGAMLRPGHASVTNLMDDPDNPEKKSKQGVVYIDDFEGSTTATALGRSSGNAWVLASVPQDEEKFPESRLFNDPGAGVNRAQLSWYTIDPFGNGDALADRSENNYTADVNLTEVFPNRQTATLATQGGTPNLRTLDLTYFPSKRGPYNFERPGGTIYSEGLVGEDLNAPETRWGGIMRQLTNNNFEASNYEYLEMWMLSPFLGNGSEDPDQPGTRDNSGILYINLGNISEDIMRDGRQFFESGMPVGEGDSECGEVDFTDLGRVPRLIPVNPRVFDPENREKQDIGYDGLDNDGERAFFADYLNSGVPSSFRSDPANDDYRHFNDPIYDSDQSDIFKRFSKFNNPQGNSPDNALENSEGNRIFGFTQYPDSEDLNGDVSLNETESYFEYKIDLESNQAGGMSFNKYVIDAINGENGRIWYRVRIPLQNYDEKVGDNIDFRSIRFMRMYLKNFDKPVTLRFASLELIRNQWRQYTKSSDYLGGTENGISNSTLDVNAVNIEENSEKEPFNYVLPPGVEREQQPGSQLNIQQNEQSLSMNIGDLRTDEYRAIFKNLHPDMQDMRVYDRFQLFVHVEEQLASIIDNSGFRCGDLEDGDLSMFIRLGSDFENNYYEYKIPLSVSDPTLLPRRNDTILYQQVTWPSINQIDFSLKALKEAKVERDNNGANAQEVYESTNFVDGLLRNANSTISVKGYPNLGLVKGIMIGVVNNDREGLDGPTSHCAEIWVNEMRLGFDERGGVAALARMDVQLADFGNLTVAGNYSSVGWGSLDQKLAERALESTMKYDVSTTLELGKFFPEKWGIKLPFYGLYSNEIIRPEYDAYDLDIPLKEKLDNADSKVKRDSIRSLNQTTTEIKSINFTDVRKEPSGKEKKPMPWDISNFSVSYAYNNTTKRDPIIEENTKEEHYAAINYNYSTKPKFIQPFKKLIRRDKYLKLISEFNFNLIPNAFSVGTDMDRDFEKTKYRFVNEGEISTFYRKRFTWNRDYTLSWDLTKALKFNFNAGAQSIIDEPGENEFNPETQAAFTPQERNDSIKTNIKNLGRPKIYNHNVTLSYTLPLKKIPLMDWIDVKAQYKGGYQWDAGPLIRHDVEEPCIDLGNTISNNSTRQIDGNFNFESLYNKSNYLKQINKPGSKRKRGSKRGRGSSKDSKKDSKNARKDADMKAAKEKSLADVDSPDEKSGKTKDGKDGKKGKEKGKSAKKKSKSKKKKVRKEREPSKVARIALRPLMMIRKGRASYVENFASEVPGFTPQTQLLGLNNWNSPGWGYIIGIQPNDNWFSKASNTNGWITRESTLNKDVMRSYSQKINANLTVEPFKDFKIELEAVRSYDDLDLSLYSYLPEEPNDPGSPSSFDHRNLNKVGNFTMSYMALNTFFTQDSLALFEEFRSSREIFANRLGGEGFGLEQQDVLIPAFLAAYTGKDPNTYFLGEDGYGPKDLKKLIPRPNWRVNYRGLSKLPWFKERFQNFSLDHSYKSTLNFSGFRTEHSFVENYELDQLRGQRHSENLDYNFRDTLSTNNYFSRYALANVGVTEAFSPLLGLDIQLKNGLVAKVKFDKSRDLRMDIGFNRVYERKANKYTATLGYVMKDVYLAFFYGNKGKKKKRKKKSDTDGAPGNKDKGSDLAFDVTFSYTRNTDFIFELISQENASPRANKDDQTIQFNPTVSYDINKNLNLTAYFDWKSSRARLEGRHIITTDAGIKIIFSLN